MPASVPADFVQGGLLDKLSRVSDAETIRRLLGLGMGVCDSKKDGAENRSQRDGNVFWRVFVSGRTRGRLGRLI